MSDPGIRRLRPGEQDAFIESVRIPFLDPVVEGAPEEPWVDRARRRTDPERSWVAEDRGRFVANCAIHSMDLTVPAPPGRPCPVVPMGGVTAVGVHPTHRRRGLLTRLMAEMLADCRRRGEPVAGLHASESAIYGRFGFGLASQAATCTIDSREARMLVPPPPLGLQFLGRGEAAKILPELFDRQRRTRAGEVNRDAIRWEELLADEPARRQGGKGAFIAACDEGYVVYRAVESPGAWQRGSIVVEELRGMSAEVEAGLWKFVFDLDLADEVTAARRPVDEPLGWRLADPRQLRVTGTEDRLWLRILDVPAALTARGYRLAGRLVLDVVAPPAGADPGDPAVGRWLLDAGPDGAVCGPAGAGRPADLRLDLTALGSLYLGATAASSLAAAGRVEELTPGSLRVADGLLGTWPAPATGTGF